MIQKLSIQYGIELSFQTGADDYYQNCSASAGPDLIHLGIYQDPELETISFFHELGHCLNIQEHQKDGIRSRIDDPYFHYQEAIAWRAGLRIATENGISFSEQALTWAKIQLTSYFQDNHPERTPLQFYPRALVEAFEEQR